MGLPEQFVIPFSGLALGNHSFDFQIGKSFFEAFEDSGIRDGNISVLVEMEKQERMLVFSVEVKGTVNVPCDRCLDYFDLAFEGREVLYVKFGDAYREESADVIIIPRTEHRYDLKQILYEVIQLSLPYQRIHPGGDSGESCNPDILAKLESLRPRPAADPRWDALKGSFKDNNETEIN
ncbi:MAG TPA: DUF177 domain-containing protein [Bacteroidales bacterium]|nr:DUF177 domain-containing protein [Bacteroidales bacterium]HSA43768.1 DUF177 domain-containing protein [Bacteroidales bacterium]